MGNYLVDGADLTSIANAIRTKGGTSAQLAFPADFVSAIGAIPAGGGLEPDYSVTLTPDNPASTSNVTLNIQQDWSTPGMFVLVRQDLTILPQLAIITVNSDASRCSRYYYSLGQTAMAAWTNYAITSDWTAPFGGAWDASARGYASAVWDVYLMELMEA